ncbi:DUF6461 domain-containing protein [Streptomyces olivaceus]|uniref:DUF6461 domain-containing protein n=1 Tax=Streptomyces olivaceus TaxID=47716 RepID=UPI0036681EF8
MPEPITAADYADIFGADDDLLESHCVTYVQGTSPAGLLHELRARRTAPGTPVTGVSALRELTQETYEQAESAGTQLVGVTAVGDWAVMVEYNGLLGTDPEVVLPATRGRTAVSHMANVAPGEPFYWYEDGSVRMSYDEDPYLRGGEHPDELLDVMRQVGFGPLADPDEDDREPTCALANFALAHHVTGVRLTRRLLETAEFTCGFVPQPVPSWLRV